jgi:FkbM family methyltransferase
VLSALKQFLVGGPLEAPARRLMLLSRNPVVRQNHRDDEALRSLIRHLPDDANCVDVGANVGYLLAAMVDGCPDGRHIAFEPVAELAGRLKRRFPDVDVRAQAVAETAGRTVFTVVPRRPSRSGISATLDLSLDAEVEEVEVEVVTLDGALPETYRPTLVKIDVEGAELETLLGARRVLTQHRPILAIEHQYGRHPDPARTERIFEVLTDLGYQLRTMSGTTLDRAAFCGLVAAGAERNFLAQVA